MDARKGRYRRGLGGIRERVNSGEEFTEGKGGRGGGSVDGKERWTAVIHQRPPPVVHRNAGYATVALYICMLVTPLVVNLSSGYTPGGTPVTE